MSLKNYANETSLPRKPVLDDDVPRHFSRNRGAKTVRHLKQVLAMENERLDRYLDRSVHATHKRIRHFYTDMADETKRFIAKIKAQIEKMESK